MPNTVGKFESDVDTKLPIAPLTQDRELRDELQLVYNAIQILQVALSEARAANAALDLRVTALENAP